MPSPSSCQRCSRGKRAAGIDKGLGNAANPRLPPRQPLKILHELRVLAQGRSLRSVLDLEAMHDISEDLGGRRLGYWHDAGICARREQILGEEQGEWLESFGNRLSGMTLGDASGDGLYLPPGAGGVDYALCASYVPRTGNAFPVVLELDLSIAPGEMPGMRSCLDKYGL